MSLISNLDFFFFSDLAILNTAYFKFKRSGSLIRIQYLVHIFKALSKEVDFAIHPSFVFVNHSLGKPQKKVLLLMARPLRPNPPPPSSIMAVGTLELWFQNELFFPYWPGPFFAGSL